MWPAKALSTSSSSIIPAMGLGIRTPKPSFYSYHCLKKTGIDSPTRGKFKSSKLVYDDIHQALCALRCDVLVILDCCFATNTTSLFQTGMPTTLSHVGKKMVFVGASGASEKTTDRRHATLTYRLCKAIKSVNGWPASLNVILGELNYETSQSRRKRKRDSHIHFAGFDDSSPEERDLFLHRIPGA
ncbi:hypothetical protein V8F33_000759 [Rhypophila sp. PSN 637]